MVTRKGNSGVAAVASGSALLLLQLLLFPAASTALPAMTSWMKWAQEAAAQHEQEQELHAAAAQRNGNKRDGDDADPSMHWFTSALDHFDRQNKETWQQRSFQNATFFNGSGPVFLCVGGEGPAMDASVLQASVHCNDMVELAPKVGALMLAVEHRYCE